MSEDCSEGLVDRVESHIRDYGHSVICVFPTTPDERSFCYTVGRAQRGKAELILVGLGGQTGQTIVNMAAAEIDSWEREAQPGDRLINTANFDLPLGSVGQKRGLHPYLCQAVHRGEALGHPVTALQLVMCDSSGVYPGKPGFNAAQMKGQICLSESGQWDFEGQ